MNAQNADFRHLRKPDFERLVKTLKRGQADAVPLIELGIHPVIKEAVLGRPLASVAEDVEFMLRMGYDFIKVQPRINFETNRAQVAGGDIDRAWASEHGGVIQSFEDFEAYPWPKPEDIDYSLLEEARTVVPEGMGIIGQYGDIFTTSWEMMGFENFSIALFEEPELVDAIMENVGSLITSMFDTMADMDWLGAMWFSDDIAYTTGLMVSPAVLRERFFPWLRKVGDAADRAEVPLLYHTDGVLWEVFDDIIACGVSAQHPIEPLAMEIKEVKERVGDRLCLCGNIDVDVLSRGTPEQVQAKVRQRLSEVAPGGGYCLGSSNSVPDFARVENYLMMVKTALEEGRY